MKGTADLVGLVQQLIRNQCVNDGNIDSGHEHRSVGTLAEFFGEKGEIVEPAPGRQSVIYRVSGSDPAVSGLLLLPHLDVVPANPAGWMVDPFAAEVVDGFVWGRGAVDMLNVTAAMAVLFKRYLVGELPPLPGDLILAAVADEEAAGTLGAKYLLEERPELVTAPFVLTEVAYPSLGAPDGPLYPVAVGEKGPFWSKLRSVGVPGHGSSPYLADNALAPLVEALSGLFTGSTPIALTNEWRDLIGRLGFDPTLTRRLLNPDELDEALSELAMIDPGLACYFHAISHLTVSPNKVRGGIKANMIPDAAEAEVDVRGLPGMDRATVDEHLRKMMGAAADRVEISPMADHLSYTSSRNNPLWEAIDQALFELTGVKRALPVLMPVTTDARFFRAKGAVAYGVGWFDDRVEFSEFLSLFHGNNERVTIESLERTAKLLETVVA
ncbi:MAG: M20/M25/M40 family metallo-hydrolase, partial [Actinomycetota bacterium]